MAGIEGARAVVCTLRSDLRNVETALENGVSNMVDADLSKEASALAAGKVRQDLATRALAIANAARHMEGVLQMDAAHP